MGWLRTSAPEYQDEAAEIAEVTAWLRVVMEWIGATALVIPVVHGPVAVPDSRPAAPRVAAPAMAPVLAPAATATAAAAA